MIQVLRDDVVAIYVAAGYGKAGSWNDDKLLAKLGGLVNLAAEGGVELEDDLKEILDQIIGEGVEETEIVANVDEDDEDQQEDDQEEDDQEEEEVDPDIEAVETEMEKLEALMKKQKEEIKAKKAALRKKKTEIKRKKGKSRTRGIPGPDVGNPEDIKSLKNRLFFAGIAIRELGIEKGLTDELVAKIDGMAEKENPKASKSQAAFAWHAINGYLNG